MQILFVSFDGGLSVTTESFKSAQDRLPLCVMNELCCDGYAEYKHYALYFTKSEEEIQDEMLSL